MAVSQRQLSITEHSSLKAIWQARADNARALLERAQLDLQRTRVNAPFGGRVSTVEVSAGNRVQAGVPLLRLIDYANLELRAQVPTRHLATVRSALSQGRVIEARSTVDNRSIFAVLKRLSAEVKQGSGGADAIFEIKESQAQNLELGRTVELHLSLTPIDNVIAIPVTALYGTNTIYVLREDRMHGIAVQRQGEYRDPQGQPWVLLKNPELSEDEMIVSTQLPNAVEGLKVRVQR